VPRSAISPATSQNSLCVMRARLAARRDAMPAMAMATAHAFSMISEYARQRARPAGFVDAVLIRALPGSRYHVSIPHLLAYHSTSTQGALTANTTNLSLAGAPRRTPESLLGTITAV